VDRIAEPSVQQVQLSRFERGTRYPTPSELELLHVALELTQEGRAESKRLLDGSVRVVPLRRKW
jgi:hypothetical protein